MKAATVNDVGSMSLISKSERLSNSFFVSVLNSNVIFDYYREFINCTVNIQINDLRQIPIIIPNNDDLEEIERLFRIVYEHKKTHFADNEKSLPIPEEDELDLLIANLYSVDT